MQITDELLAELEHKAQEAIADSLPYGASDLYDPAVGLTSAETEFACVANPATLLALIAHIRSLTERLEKAEKDAARYRWLRHQPNDCSVPRIDICYWQPCGDDSVNDGEGLRLEAADEAIDAAISQEGADHE